MRPKNGITRVCVFSQPVRPNWFKFDVEDPHTYKNTSISLFLKIYTFFSSNQKLDPKERKREPSINKRTNKPHTALIPLYDECKHSLITYKTCIQYIYGSRTSLTLMRNKPNDGCQRSIVTSLCARSLVLAMYRITTACYPQSIHEPTSKGQRW